MKYFSTFSGIGGFELGIQLAYEALCHAHGSENGGIKEYQTGDEGQGLFSTERKDARTTQGSTGERSTDLSHERPLCVGYSEIDKYATQIYQKHFPEHKNYGDITKIEARLLPDFDLLVGGFPCQAFSIAGKRGGFEDTRGTMFFELARIIKEKQPRLFLFENVKGLLSHDQGRTFYRIIATLDELGYDLEWQVLNSKNHGVPQNRERVFIIGHLRGTPRPEVFPFGSASEGSIEVIGSLSSEKWDRFNESSRRVYDTSGIAPTIPTVAGGGHTPKIDAGEFQIRKLTPTECERLQGFPDGWTKGISDTQRYKCLGNAVTVNVIRDICGRLL